MYTTEETKYMIEIYNENPTRETVKQLATELNRTEKSIIGKLSKEKVYKRQGYVSKLGEKPITKEEMRKLLEVHLSINLEGLEKSPKQTLKRLCTHFNISTDEKSDTD